MQCGNPQRMNTGTPNRSGRQLPSLANFTDVVIINPHPIARKRHLIHPTANLVTTIVFIVVGTSNETNPHPIILNSKTNNKNFQSLVKPAIPVKRFHLQFTTARSPKENRIAPTTPPTFRNIIDAIPIHIPASIALNTKHTCYSW